MNAVVSEKGQVTIPKAIRDGLGLVPGSVLEFTENRGYLMARRVVKENPIAAWRGRCRLPKDVSVTEYLRLTRDG